MFHRSFALLAGIVCGIALQACGTGDSSTESAVMRSERLWVDTTRDLPRTPARELRVVLWWTSGSKPVPLLILAHGFGGLPEKFDAFARAVAAAGVIVAAPAFPLTNANAPGGHERGFGDFVNQPGDVKFVVDRLLEASADPADPLFSRIVAQRIALLGHSLGGLTALAATRKNCCRDARITAVILVAPLAGFFLDRFGSDPISSGPPTLLLHGLADMVLSFDGSLLLYEQMHEPKALIGLMATGHSEALESQVAPAPPPRRAAEVATITFLDAVFSGRLSGFLTVLDMFEADGHLIERNLGALPEHLP